MFLVSLVDLKVYAFIFYAIGDLGPILFLTLSHAMMSSIVFNHYLPSFSCIFSLKGFLLLCFVIISFSFFLQSL